MEEVTNGLKDRETNSRKLERWTIRNQEQQIDRKRQN